jgi:hypothetical protein
VAPDVTPVMLYVPITELSPTLVICNVVLLLLAFQKSTILHQASVFVPLLSFSLNVTVVTPDNAVVLAVNCVDAGPVLE